MTEELCPVCGCSIVGGGHQKGGVKYCCEPCATGSGPCQCGCCHPVEEKKEAQIKNTECGFVVEVQGVLCRTI
jgi:hypothetical protein